MTKKPKPKNCASRFFHWIYGGICNPYSRLRFFKWLTFLALLISIVFLTATVIYNYADWKLDFLGINPHDPIQQEDVHVWYPYTAPLATTTPYFSADIFLRYYGTLTERQPVYVSTGGFVYPPDGQKLIGTKNPSFNYSVLVGYTGASLYNETISNPAVPFIGGQTYAPLVENSTPQISSIPVDLPQSLFPWNQIITWDVQGDYYPYIMIKFSNGTEITQTYPDYKIHINGYDVVQQEKYTRVSTWLAIVLFFLTVILSGEIFYKVSPDIILKFFGIERSRCNNYEYPDETNTGSNKSQPSPKIPQPPSTNNEHKKG
ncbi:MAG: hypothetical protein WCE46_05640 [Methanoregula sp.]|uniref:hypothetical protein n=1 Tax=Methanoregula sp. TaxID=2052170 RepID=UPI003C725AEB